MVLNKEKVARDIAYFNDFYENYDSDPLPPGVDPATYIDPNWGWFDKLCKRATPYVMQIIFVLTVSSWAYVLPFWIRDMKVPKEMKNSDTDESDVTGKPTVYIGE